MGFYKIRNITDRLPKRHSKKDSTVTVTFNDGVTKKDCKINVGDNFLIKTHNLPISIHTLRAQNLITVETIGENEFNREKSKLERPKLEIKEIKKVEEVIPEEIDEAKPKRTYKKRTTSKKSESVE